VPIARDMLWSASMGPTPLPERVRIAAHFGYRELSVWATDRRELVAAGIDPGEVRRQAEAAGVALSFVDGIAEWYPHEPPRFVIEGASLTVEDLLLSCDAFGATKLAAVAPYPTSAPIDDLIASFAELCDRAADHGVAVALEFTPFPPLDSVAKGWEVVRGAQRSNAGLLFDTWHFFRGNPDYETLATIPGERIFGVQINDGADQLVESLVKDTFLRRRKPGDGVFDLPRVLSVLAACGPLGSVGPEVWSAELQSMPSMDAAREVTESFDRVTEKWRD